MFEAMLYIVAIVAILGFFGETRHTTTEAAPAPATTEPTAEPIEPAATATTEAQPEPITESTAPEPQPEPAALAPAMAQTIAQPVAALTIPTEASTEGSTADLASITSAELRRRCQSAGVKWRNAKGKGKHLSKGEMIAALTA